MSKTTKKQKDRRSLPLESDVQLWVVPVKVCKRVGTSESKRVCLNYPQIQRSTLA